MVSVAQLHEAGLGRSGIHTRVRTGRLVRLHRGVYAVGHAQLTPLGWRWAAVLACGGPGRAALSHRSAAAAWDLLPSPAKFDVSTLASARSTAKIRVHRGLTLHDVTEVDGLPLTTVARTIVDLTAIQTPHQTERLVHRAEHLRLLDMHSLNAQLARAEGRRTKPLIAAIGRLQVRRSRDHSRRPRGAVPCAHRQSAVASPARQLPTRRLRGRLLLAGCEAHRRGRRSGHPPDAAGVRGRPPAGRGSLDDGVQVAPLHLAAGRLRASISSRAP